jgi:hypothetical protein
VPKAGDLISSTKVALGGSIDGYNFLLCVDVLVGRAGPLGHPSIPRRIDWRLLLSRSRPGLGPVEGPTCFFVDERRRAGEDRGEHHLYATKSTYHREWKVWFRSTIYVFF